MIFPLKRGKFRNNLHNKGVMIEEKEENLKTILKKSISMGKKDILSLPQIKNNPLSIIIIKKYMEGGKIDFDKLIESTYRFSNSKNLDYKLKFIFGLYDCDNDGFISSIELYDLLKTLNRGILEDWKLQNVVDKTFAEIGEYSSKLNYEQFKYLISSRSENFFEIFNCEE